MDWNYLLDALAVFVSIFVVYAIFRAFRQILTQSSNVHPDEIKLEIEVDEETQTSSDEKTSLFDTPINESLMADNYQDDGVVGEQLRFSHQEGNVYFLAVN